jgi:LysM repeat protein
MDLFKGYKIHREDDGFTLILYLSPSHAEFSKEISSKDSSRSSELNQNVEEYVKSNFPNLKINAVKVMVGTMLVASFALGSSPVKAAETTNTQASTVSYTSYTVVSGDTLYAIAKKFNTTVDQIKLLNNLTSDVLQLNQVLKIPSSTAVSSYTNYTVVSGDSLSVIAGKFKTTVTEIQRLNNLTSTNIYAGQILKVPSVQTTAPTTNTGTTTYKVISGDSLWSIAVKFNTTVDKLKVMNNLTTTTLTIGQVLTVPSVTSTPAPTPAPSTTSTAPTISYINHTVASGENSWTISIKYGIPMSELLRVNNFTESTTLSIGQIIRVPVHTVPATSVPGPQFGEYLDWWTQAQYLFPINKTAKIIDFQTGRSFYVKRTIGANHSDTEPLTSQDAATMLDIWGGTYSWKTRAVIVEVDGRRIAASMTSMPHGIEYIGANSFDGHFDIHFLNSTRHVDGTVDPYHQAQIKMAAGMQ